VEKILTELEGILDSLSDPAKLEGGELSLLNSKWVHAIARLNSIMAQKVTVPRKDMPKLRKRLETILARMPKIQIQLSDHKSEVADQLFLENRRVQAIRQGGYNVLSKRSQLIHQRA
jgi:hypothetical protein